jgi:hypothetical protein
VSHTITPAAPGAAPPGVASAGAPPAEKEPGPIGRVVEAVQRGLEGTPGRLRLAAGVAIVAAIVAGLGGGFALWERSAALSEAQDSAANLVLLQGVRTNLAQADADAANAFLRYGLEPKAQQQSYAAAIQAASTDLTAAARGADATDAAVLGQVNDKLTTYVGLVEAARANNRQGLPIGASYLSVASSLLRDEILVQLGKVADHEGSRTDDAYDRASAAAIWLTLSAIVGVGALVAVQVWLAQRSRRVLNLPAAIATAGLVVTLLGAGLLMAVAQSQAEDVRDGAYSRAAALGQARVHAFDAKSEEALTLIKRGSGTPEDQAWTDSYNQADAAVRRAGSDSALLTPLQAYGDKHKAIRDLDNSGSWEKAVQAAVATDPASANAAFNQFAGASRDALAAAAAQTDDGLGEAKGGLALMAWVLVLVGLLAAGGAWWGISLRLDEYR